MNSTFLVCGYPRSRTMWLSRFLSVQGLSICTHEATEHAGSVEEFWANGALYSSAGEEFYGNADSANIYVLSAVLAAKPLTRAVWIDRPIVEVAVSMKNAGMPVIEMALQNLMKMRSVHADLFDLVIPYHDLRHATVCKQLWEFCLPGVEFDYGRWGMFNIQKIGYSKENPMPKKSYEKFLGWAQREINELNNERMMP